MDLVLSYSDVAECAIAAGVREHVGALLESASKDGQVVDATALLVGSAPEVRCSLYPPWAPRT